MSLLAPLGALALVLFMLMGVGFGADLLVAPDPELEPDVDDGAGGSENLSLGWN